MMRGKPIEQITRADLDLLISDGVAEDRRIEFKVDVPVSAEEQKVQRKTSPGVQPVDRSWTRGSRLADYGRDALAEEIVAFANSEGGTLILGIEETKEAPPRASAINPLPDVAGLERRLRDALASCIEPRLPYVAVRGVATEPDGSGVIVIETSGSALGPHWVSKSRKPTIRREDRCDPLTMPELHEMVLRNSRQFDSVKERARIEHEKFSALFSEYLIQSTPSNYLGVGESKSLVWLEKTNQAALGAQVIISPHFDLGIPRLESLQGLTPRDESVTLGEGPAQKPTAHVGVYTYAEDSAQKILGGVQAISFGNPITAVTAYRSGLVIVSFRQIDEQEKCTCTAGKLIGLVGFALGVYHRLRLKSTYAAAPAELFVNLYTRKHVGVGNFPGYGFNSSYGRLDEHVPFPAYTVGEYSEFSTILQEIGSDLLNAGGLPALNLPKVAWTDSI